MNKIVIFLFAVVITSCATNSMVTTERNLAENVIEALEANDFNIMREKCLATKEEMKYFYKHNKNLSPKIRKLGLESLDKEYEKRYIEVSKKNFESFKEKVQVKIHWGKVQIIEINKLIEEKSPSCDIDVVVEYNGHKYILMLDDCIQIKNNWRLGDRLKWKGENRENGEK